jgi:hypothetical protein
MYRIEEGCDPDTTPGNTCGVPHSCVAEGDNMSLEPSADPMYWFPGMMSQTVAFVTDGTPFGDSSLNGEWDGDLSSCQVLEIDHPPSDLVATTPNLLKAQTNKRASELSDEQLQQVAADLAASVGSEAWQIEIFDTSDSDSHELFFWAPPDVCIAIVDKLRLEGAHEVNDDVTITSASVHTEDGEE